MTEEIEQLKQKCEQACADYEQAVKKREEIFNIKFLEIKEELERIRIQQKQSIKDLQEICPHKELKKQGGDLRNYPYYSFNQDYNLDHSHEPNYGYDPYFYKCLLCSKIWERETEDYELNKKSNK